MDRNSPSLLTQIFCVFCESAYHVILKLFPGIKQNFVEAVLNIKGLKGVILETYGAGNALTDKWFIDCLRNTTEKQIPIFNVTQCNAGSVKLKMSCHHLQSWTLPESFQVDDGHSKHSLPLLIEN